MASKKPERVKSAEEIAGETEFYRRRNFPACTVRYMKGNRDFTAVLSALGHELGTKTEITTRGKVTQVLYSLPALDRYHAHMALPVARERETHAEYIERRDGKPEYEED